MKKLVEKHGIGKSLLILLCLVMAGPEIGLGLELIALIELSGAELFLFYFTAPLWFYWYKVQTWLRKADPYFFVPCREHLFQCPSLIAHAIPFLLVASVGAMPAVVAAT